MEKYVLNNVISTDKKYVKQYLSLEGHNFKFPCKLTVVSKHGEKHYLVDRGNVKGHEFLVIDWSKSIAQ